MEEVPLGFRFVPTDLDLDLDLIRDYLLNKLTNQPLPSDAVVIEYNVYNMEPWNLPEKRMMTRAYYAMMGRMVNYVVKCGDGTSNANRILGYWKRTRPTPQDKVILDEKKKIVGIMKTFVFHYYTTNNDNNDTECRDIKTGWVMREYTLNSEQFQPLVLCSIINKSQFNISIEYDDKNNYIKGVDCPPIDPVEAEQNRAFCRRAFQALIENTEEYLAQRM